ncbi:hypothetical protein B0H34DRAFT_737430 [Crassisporium funariophilum]|nr:hypothetical protein B0H34DRAFT_737430 [Crassisporium funariophilum]
MSGPLEVFFARYHHFVYNSSASATSEFQRLCKVKGSVRCPLRQTAYKEFKDALTRQFNVNYGTDARDITAWQTLCASLRVEPIPAKLKDCRQAVLSTHVNLVDLVQSFTTKKRVEIFPSVKHLSDYTIKHEKYFPRDNVHAGQLLQHLLRHIHNPSKGLIRGRGTGSSRGRGNVPRCGRGQ